ncbi:MAG: trehalose-6-phosphate synthase [Chloroflexi bacterium]|nr:trehalose-6-phosphate synthase [Chloroflexota bacterium]
MTASVSGERRSERVVELCKEMLRERRLLLVSNRGPVDYLVTPDGHLQAHRGSGAVVTALSSLTRHIDFTWIASAMGEGDRQAAEASQGKRFKSPIPGQTVSVRFVVTPRRAYHKFYNIVCNPLLWFLQHYMWSAPYTPNIDDSVYDAWETGYIPVNQAFAEAVISEAQEGHSPPFVMLHDYHLYLAPNYIRQKLPKAIMQHFIHVPWPGATYWQLIPSIMRIALCRSLCANDIVGFQSMRDVRGFLETCEAFLPDAKVDHTDCCVQIDNRRVAVRAYPISIDVEELRRIANSPRALEYEKRLSTLSGEKTIVRVDRIEPSKNILRGFRAFQILLEKYPEFRERVKFLAFLVPSRSHIRQYQRYVEEIQEMVNSINSAFGHEGWQPVKVFYENNYAQAIAGMRLYDVLMVNSVIEGMNPVAKEGPVVNTRQGVLILSESAGGFEQLREGALEVSPTDLFGTAQALYQALAMPLEERERRQKFLIQAIEREDITHWLERQLTDMKALV